MQYLWGPSLKAEIDYRRTELIKAGGGSRIRRTRRTAERLAGRGPALARPAAGRPTADRPAADRPATTRARAA